MYQNCKPTNPDWHSSRGSPQAVERGASARLAKWTIEISQTENANCPIMNSVSY